VLVLIMAGGVGERFWPASRRLRPKQLLDLTGRGSMLRVTLDRVGDLARANEIFILTNAEQRGAILAEVAGAVPPENVIGEPEGRNTAPCIGLAALLARRTHGDAPMLVLPADHLVEPAERFREAVRAGSRYVATHDALLTFGVMPTRPETGYGYLSVGAEVWRDGAARVCRVGGFLEKPSPERARELVASGCLWNSGMFMWRTGTVLDRIERHLPELGAVLRRVETGLGTHPLDEVLNREYRLAPAVSIDYGVMEKADNVAVMPVDFGWNDVGSWEFVRDVHPADAAGNVAVGDHVVIDGSNNTIVSPDRLVGLVGVDDVIVVSAGDALLVCRRDRAQDVKRVVAELKRRGRDDIV
jgi:mannose-1-phosphate guanylyltransferase